MKNNLFNKESNYNDIKQKIMDNMEMAFNISDLKFIDRGLKSFNNLKDNDRIVSFSKEVDKLYSSTSTNEFNKIPIILGGVIIIDDYNENASKLNNEEMALLSNYSLVGDIDFYNKLFTPNVLKSICSKTDDVLERYNFLEVVEDSYDMFYEEMNDDNIFYIREGLERFSKRLCRDDFIFLFDALNQRKMEIVEEKGIAL